MKVAGAFLIAALLAVPVSAGQTVVDLAELERVIAADPENLKVAAEYRQEIIARRAFDRSIDFFRKLARARTAGPNAHINLAFAYVDKVPTSGEIRRLYLARDAMGELTRAIERQPSVLAYHVRGVINLFFNRLIFKRTKRGIADTERALALITPETPQALVERVWVAYGDGYWRDENRAKAREIWAAAAARFRENADLKLRVGRSDAEIAPLVKHAFAEDVRVDTSLRGVVPEA
jgi:hypothetical protein